jgi:hypothetical protein
MKRAGAACIAIVANLFGATLDAQRLAPAVLTSTSSPTASTAFHRHPPSSPTLPKAKDYTLEGATIGGIAMGLFGAYFAAGMCGMDDHEGSCSGAALTGLLGGVTVGATLGGIIGSGKKKALRYPSDSALLGPLPAERPPVRVRPDSALLPRARSGGGNGIALGAVMVGGGVALLSTLGCSLDQSGGHENCAWNAVKRGAVGAVAGGVAAALISGLFAGDPRAP